mgnify:CR=1 FL=1
MTDNINRLLFCNIGNEFEVDGQKVFYHTMIMKMPSGDYDCFMMTMDLAMLFDMDIASSGTGSLLINTPKKPYPYP